MGIKEVKETEGIIAGFLLGILTMVKAFPDPFHKKYMIHKGKKRGQFKERKVTFWEWIYKELEEELWGEKG